MTAQGECNHGHHEHAQAPEAAQTGQDVASAPSDGLEAWERFRAIYGNAFPDVDSPQTFAKMWRVAPEDWASMMHQAWLHYCIGQDRNWFNGELTDAGRRDKDAAERTERIAAAALKIETALRALPGDPFASHLYGEPFVEHDIVQSFFREMAEAEVTQ